MFLISVEKSFSAAHFLRGYRGKCENMHGHRYKVVVRVLSPGLNDIGLAYDFSELKRQVSDVVDRFDHACLNEARPFVDKNPSAENIATFIYEELVPVLKNGVALDSVEVWESPDTCALYRKV